MHYVALPVFVDDQGPAALKRLVCYCYWSWTFSSEFRSGEQALKTFVKCQVCWKY